MQLQEGTKVYCFTRVRNVDGEPLILETSYYPQYIYPNLTRELVQTHSFYSLLYHVGITPAAAEDTLSWNTSSQRRTNCVSLFMAWLMVSRSMIRIKPLLSRGGNTLSRIIARYGRRVKGAKA